MQIGVNTWVWVAPPTTSDLEWLIPQIAAMGFNLVELPFEVPNSFNYARARELADTHGLAISTVVAIGPDRDLISPDPAVRADAVAYVRHCIEAAHQLGSRILAGPLYSAVGRTWQMSAAERERTMDELAQILRPLAEYAYQHGVTLCVEPLNRFETSLINLTSQGCDLIDRVNHPGCKLLLDTFHMNIEERSLGAAIRMAGSRIGHVHTCENDRGAPGSGHVPWQEVADALKEVGYNGPLVIESFSSEVQTIARAAAVWRSFASSQDALAREGLAFLRRLFA
jgi:Sugar phosphate isomerases/epimerases